MGSVVFTAHGLPAPKGSKNQFGGESSKRVKPWMGDVARAAGEAMNGRPVFRGPLSLGVTFSFPYRKADFNSRGELRPNAPRYVTTRPDLDKLERAIADALTGIIYADDNQIAVIHSCKIYGHSAFALVQVEELP